MSKPASIPEFDLPHDEAIARLVERYHEYGNDLLMLGVLARGGFAPRTIYDVGGSNGHWSALVSMVFPGARFEIFEPLADLSSDYAQAWENAPRIHQMLESGQARLHKIALGDKTGTCRMTIEPDGFSSTSLPMKYPSSASKVADVPQWALDEYVAAHGLEAPDLIKMDTQGSELNILRGGPRAVSSVSAVLCECWLRREYEGGTPLWIEVANFLAERGLHLWDTGWVFRCPVYQRSVAQDLIFLRSDLPFSPLRGASPGQLETRAPDRAQTRRGFASKVRSWLGLR